MYGYRNPYQPQDSRFIGGFGLLALPFLGGLAGGFLGSALYRPFYGYPGFGYPGFGYSGFGGPGVGGLGFGGPGVGYPYLY